MKKNFFYYHDSSVIEIILHRVKSWLKSSIKHLLVVFQYQHEIKKTSKLRGSKKTKKAILFANGPSVKKLDPKKIRYLNFDIFSINGFIFSDFAKE